MLRTVYLGLALVSVLGCGDVSEPGPHVNPAGSGVTVRVIVGLEGGTVTAGHLTLVLPPGALAVETEIVMTEEVAAAPSEVRAFTPIYRLEPDGLELQAPAAAVLTLDPGPTRAFGALWSIPGIGAERAREPVVAEWDPGESEVRFAVTHFSTGMAVENSTLGGYLDDYAANDDAALLGSRLLAFVNALPACGPEVLPALVDVATIVLVVVSELDAATRTSILAAAAARTSPALACERVGVCDLAGLDALASRSGDLSLLVQRSLLTTAGRTAELDLFRTAYVAAAGCVVDTLASCDSSALNGVALDGVYGRAGEPVQTQPFLLPAAVATVRERARTRARDNVTCAATAVGAEAPSLATFAKLHDLWQFEFAARFKYGGEQLWGSEANQAIVAVWRDRVPAFVATVAGCTPPSDAHEAPLRALADVTQSLRLIDLFIEATVGSETYGVIDVQLGANLRCLATAIGTGTPSLATFGELHDLWDKMLGLAGELLLQPSTRDSVNAAIEVEWLADLPLYVATADGCSPPSDAHEAVLRSAFDDILELCSPAACSSFVYSSTQAAVSSQLGDNLRCLATAVGAEPPSLATFGKLRDLWQKVYDLGLEFLLDFGEQSAVNAAITAEWLADLPVFVASASGCGVASDLRALFLLVAAGNRADSFVGDQTRVAIAGKLGVSTTCGSPSATVCDAPDTCDASALCRPNPAPATTACGDVHVNCTSTFCDGSGACAGPALDAPGTACGSAADSICDRADTCDAAGACQPNLASTTTVCADLDVDCRRADTCDGSGGCVDAGLDPPGAACGSAADSVCDHADTCDAAGVCVTNLEPAATACGDLDVECHLIDLCNGTGSCVDSGLDAVGTACGSPTDTVCDDPDSCDVAGVCQPGWEPDTTACGDFAEACYLVDYCDGTGSCLDSGADPAGCGLADTWSPITGASPRTSHVAVWTGDRLLVWGGTYADASGWHLLATGALFDPVTGTWQPISTTGAPSPRSEASAVWTGTKLIVWGGYADVGIGTGAIYDPATDTWSVMSMVDAPSPRWYARAVWTGSKMIVWGGRDGAVYYDTGGVYDPSSDTWTATSMTNAPTPRWMHTAVWTGTRMLVWGGGRTGTPIVTFGTGASYDPVGNSWSMMSTTGAPAARSIHVAVYTGTRMIVWGGTPDNSGTTITTGGIYTDATDSWAAISTSNAPSGRQHHTAIWTGTEMVVWGGYNGAYEGPSTAWNTGGRYDPAADAWSPTSTTGAPVGRYAGFRAVWTGAQMLITGGYGPASTTTYPDGGIYE